MQCKLNPNQFHDLATAVIQFPRSHPQRAFVIRLSHENSVYQFYIKLGKTCEIDEKTVNRLAPNGCWHFDSY